MTAVFSGLIPVYKPVGMTSKDVSRHLIRRFGKLKIGHVGTLDPDADGVLPVLIGHATKLQDYLLEMPKTYRFILNLGRATTTLDASGDITEEKSWDHVTEALLARHLQQFKGQIRQIPPLYSAVKLNGRELYKHARSSDGQEANTEREKLARQVSVYDARVLRFAPPEIEMSVTCSKGTYIRTIADDLARSMGTVGHVTLLQRESSAGFSLAQCISLEALTKPESTLESYLVPMNKVSIGLPVWKPNDNVALRRLLNGQHLDISLQVFWADISGCTSANELAQKGFLIRDHNEDGVGIGEARFNQEQVMIHLKRGL